MTAKKLAGCGFLIALSIILTRVFGVILPVAGVGAVRLSFGAIPIMLAGLLYGPLAGFLTGVAADLLGFALNPMGGAFIPGLTFTAGLSGALPVFILSYRHRLFPALHSAGFGSLLLAVAVTELLCSLFLNTLFLSLALGKGFWVLLPARALARAILIPIYSLVLHILIKTYQRVFPRHGLLWC